MEQCQVRKGLWTSAREAREKAVTVVNGVNSGLVKEEGLGEGGGLGDAAMNECKEMETTSTKDESYEPSQAQSGHMDEDVDMGDRGDRGDVKNNKLSLTVETVSEPLPLPLPLKGIYDADGYDAHAHTMHTHIRCAHVLSHCTYITPYITPYYHTYITHTHLCTTPYTPTSGVSLSIG